MFVPCNTLKNFLEKIANYEGVVDAKTQYEIREFTGDNYLGEIIKVIIKGRDRNGGEKNIFLVVKKAPVNLESRKCMFVRKYYETEVFMYKNILPAFNKIQEKYNLQNHEIFRYPLFLNASLEEVKEFVILGDLSYDGYKMYESRKALDYEHLVLVMQNLARLHALSFVMKEDNLLQFEALANNVPNTENYGYFLVDIISTCIEMIIPKLHIKKNVEKIKEFRGNVKQVFDECLDAKKTHPYNVLCHGDTFRNNFLFKYENTHVSDLILVDWQMARLASPATELSYVISLSTDQPTRQKYLTTLLNIYYDTLSVSVLKMGHDVQKCYPKPIFDHHIKKTFRFGLVFALMSIVYSLRKPGDEENVEEITDSLNKGHLRVDFHEEVIERIEGLLADFTQLGFI